MPDKTVLEVRSLGISFTQYDRGLRRRELNPVKKLCFTLNQGEMAAVVGASGSGKVSWLMLFSESCLTTAGFRARFSTGESCSRRNG